MSKFQLKINNSLDNQLSEIFEKAYDLSLINKFAEFIEKNAIILPTHTDKCYVDFLDLVPALEQLIEISRKCNLAHIVDDGYNLIIFPGDCKSLRKLFGQFNKQLDFFTIDENRT